MLTFRVSRDEGLRVRKEEEQREDDEWRFYSYKTCSFLDYRNSSHAEAAAQQREGTEQVAGDFIPLGQILRV